MVAGLLAVYFLSNRPVKAPELPVWISFEKSAIERIEFRRPGGPPPTVARFAREAGLWKKVWDTGSAPIDTGELDRALGAFKGLRGVDVVTDSPSKYALFDLEETAALSVVLEGAETQKFWVGKRSEDGDFTFMRRGADPAVWSVRGYEPWTLERMFGN
ncbi:MAG: hypothetical protein A3G34_16080 [Candidatus Lindowbacteria bacterium RIFCSPLOWO2_12_FULL_62_27]|nr:MAG: hypothetical protein A3I06_12380 [Candidatus Lindowbacteria bacterium RIFCSPLOWO2_02_FULL_62_12]OGH61142.1 MAG: hypothetical protein A3G34_16080 [Candidatus Lindowbacteria bacterium RIFCSPLOWO2_12_FULL_62_27]